MSSKSKLDKQNIEDILSLSPLQEGLLFHYVSNPENRQYFEQFSFTLSGDMNIELFKGTWKHLVERNEMLRTVFAWESLDVLIQVVLKHCDPHIDYCDFSYLEPELSKREIENVKLNDRLKGIDISSEPFRIILCKYAEGKYEMIISNHHIIFDGWSMGILIKEFLQTYRDLNSGNMPDDSPKNKYKEFIKHYQKRNKESQKEYWKKYLSGFNTKTSFPTISIMNKGIERAECHKITLSDKLLERVESMVGEQQVTLASLLYSVWGILLQRYSNSNDVLFGTTVSGRIPDIKGIEEMVGLFINTLPLRVQANSDESVGEVVRKVNDTIKERDAFAGTPLVEIESCSEIEKGNGIFDSIVVIENYPINKEIGIKKNVLTIDSFSIKEMTNYDLTLVITAFNGVSLEFHYNADILSQSSIRSMGDHFLNLLYQIVDNPSIKMSDIEIITESEKARVLWEFNNTQVEYAENKTLHECFEEQVKRTPHNVAVTFRNNSLTYEQLNKKANQIAYLLRKEGIKNDCVVGIMTYRSIEMITGIMGIIKAGGAYLPIDPGYPPERVRYMLGDSKSSILLVQNKVGCLDIIVDIESQMGIKVVELEDSCNYQGDGQNLNIVNSSKDLAYVIYTSGSTGKPKGAMIEHRSVINRLNWMQNKYPINEEDAILQKTPYTFDVSVWELFWWSFQGAKCCFLEPGYEKDSEFILNEIGRNKISIIHFVPSMLNAFLDNIHSRTKADELTSLKRVFASGEALVPHQVYAFNELLNKNFNVQLHNLYGPTEATVDVSFFDCSGDREYEVIPIGKPIDNIKLYILNNDRKLQPVGIPGELYISGDGVGRGYINNFELTAEKFLPDPFVPGQTMYRSGDIARWLDDGNIEYLGRIDNQVKIRGVRIELGEIEARILKYEMVKEAVVVVKEHKNGKKYLCAYFIGHNTVDIPLLKNYLTEELPEHMIPECLVQLDNIPLLPNGKVNRKALSDLVPDMSTAVSMNNREAFCSEVTDTMHRIIKIWKMVLDVDNIGVNDDFYSIGGDSILATRIVNIINRELMQNLSVIDLLKKRTIVELAALIDKKSLKTEVACKERYSDIQCIEKKGYYEVSSAQKRLFVLNQLQYNDTSYNIPAVIKVEGYLDKQRVEKVFKQLIDRHESLRTSFEYIDENLIQRVHDGVKFDMIFTEADINQVEDVISGFIQPFCLQQAPLIKVELVKLNEKNHLLLFDMHHIISDGISLSILIKEFALAYEGKELPQLRIQYKDFSVWQNNLFKSGMLKKQEEYWLKVFEREVPVLNMPYDFPRPNIQSVEGNKIKGSVGVELNQKLKKLAAETGTTIYMVLLAALNTLLWRYTGQEDIIIGSPIAGRLNSDLENVIGVFINTLAMRNYPSGNKTFVDFLNELKENTLSAYKNQDYQFEELIDKVCLKRDMSRNPLFDIMLVLQNTGIPEIEVSGLKFLPFDFDEKTSQFDISLIVEERDGCLNICIEYCTRLYRVETITRFMSYFINILNEITLDYSKKLSEIEILTKEERIQVLSHFNNTSKQYTKSKTIHQLIEEQAFTVSDSIAAISEGRELTYKEMDKKSNQLARLLRDKGVAQDVPVILLMSRSAEVGIGVQGILKAGGAFVPIDETNPEERISFILEDTCAPVIVTDSNVIRSGLIERIKGNPYIVNLDDSNLEYYSDEKIENINTIDNLAYIIYTSGSTGKPKGVQVQHNNLMNIAFGWRDEYCLDKIEVNLLQLASFSFDVFIGDIMRTWLNGGKMVICSRMERLEFHLLYDKINKHRISIIESTPALMIPFMDYIYEEKLCINSLKILILGSDICKVEDYRRLQSRFGHQMRIINSYGITEATIDSSYYEESYGSPSPFVSVNLPIGKPLPNIKMYILNEYLSPQPIGVIGELYIGGSGVARGYLNRLGSAESKFICEGNMFGERLYRTGDIARWLPDGNIEFLGRADYQVKIRGIRIELGEIESILLSHQAIKEAVVVEREQSNSNKYLVAYITLNQEVEIEELRTVLQKSLPLYMVPDYFITLDKLPLSPNGKVDRNMLPKFERKPANYKRHKKPRNDLEAELVEIWKEVLCIEEVGINDSFFELGGNSLLILKLFNKIRLVINKEITVASLFSYHTIQMLMDYISESENKTKPKTKSIEDEILDLLTDLENGNFSVSQTEKMIKKIGGKR